MKWMNPFAVDERSRPWFWWGISLGALLALLTWWLLRQKSPQQGKTIKRVERIVLPDDESEDEGEAPESDVKKAPTKVEKPNIQEAQDDLKRIEGIGPRSAQVLGDAGVNTFAELAQLHPDAIQDILREASVRVPYPATWPEQAALAAASKWDELQALQDTLQGGRRV